MDVHQKATRQLRQLADLATPYAIRTVCALRIPDLLEQGSCDAQTLATQCGVDAEALRRVLRHLTTKQVFDAPTPHTFANTDLSRQLLSRTNGGLLPWLDPEGGLGRSDVALSQLLQATRTGTPKYDLLFGLPFWDDLEKHPDRGQAFHDLMSTQVSMVAAEVAHGYGWSEVEHVVDVGGGTGTLLVSLLADHPELRGTLVELSGAATSARDTFAAAGVDARCRIFVGSFFDDLPRGGDVYVLSRVLHDWSDDQARTILERCANAAGRRGRVLVIEQVVSNETPDPATTAMDIRMLVTFGGQERSLAEYQELAASAGLTLQRELPTPSGRSVLEFAAAGAADESD